MILANSLFQAGLKASVSSVFSLQWPRENFSLHYQFDIKQTSEENKEKTQLGDY